MLFFLWFINIQLWPFTVGLRCASAAIRAGSKHHISLVMSLPRTLDVIASSWCQKTWSLFSASSLCGCVGTEGRFGWNNNLGNEFQVWRMTRGNVYIVSCISSVNYTLLNMKGFAVSDCPCYSCTVSCHLRWSCSFVTSNLEVWPSASESHQAGVYIPQQVWQLSLISWKGPHSA